MTKRLRLLESYVQALGIGYSRANDTLTLAAHPVGFKVFSASIASVSGFRCIGFFCDEVAKWRSEDTSANPASEVSISLRAMTITHPTARTLLFSSPLWTGDYHSKLVSKGDTRDQIVSHGPTWVANPSITEEQTRQLEPDTRVWLREYAAQAQAAASAAFDEVDILRAFEARGDIIRDFACVLVVDVASGGRSSGDRFAWAFAGWSETLTGRVLVFDSVHCFESAQLRELGGDAALAHIASQAKERGIRTVFGDQREAMLAESAFRRNGLHFIQLPWSATSKPRAVARVRRWLVDGLLFLPRHDKLLGELRSFEERFTSNGDLTYGARGSRHDDFVALLVTLALADEERKLRGSLFARRERDPGAVSGRREVASYVNGEESPLDRLQEVAGGTLATAPRAPSRITMRPRTGTGGF